MNYFNKRKYQHKGIPMFYSYEKLIVTFTLFIVLSLCITFQQHAQIDWEGRKQDSLALVALYNATDGDNWNNNDGWLIKPLEEWYGLVVTYSGRVEYITLDHNNIKGTLPLEIFNLNQLRLLQLNDNEIVGNISHEINKVENILVIDLSNNQINGEIPPEIGDLKYLRFFSLSNNQFRGTIPLEIGHLKGLLYLRLDKNQLVCEVPSDIYNLTNLTELNLSNNQFIGKIPSEIGNLSRLYHLDLSNNLLSGILPPQIKKLQELTVLNISNNKLFGDVPAEIGNLYNLISLKINNNQFTNSIPTEINSLVKLEILELQNNSFHSIPTLTLDLDTLNIQNNYFKFNDIVLNLAKLKYKDFYLPQKQKLSDTLIFEQCNKSTIDLGELIDLSSSYPEKNNLFEWISPEMQHEEKSDPFFIIKNLDNNHNGVYKCRITNPFVPELEFFSDVIHLNVIELPQPIIYYTNSDALCEGDTLQCTTNYIDYKHKWFNNGKHVKEIESFAFDITPNGILTVQLTDSNGCSGPLSEPAVIEFNKQPSPQQLFGAEQFCQNDSVLIYTSPDFIQYEWFFQQQKIDDSLTSELTVKNPGTYQVRVTDKNNCRSELSDPKEITKIQIPEPPTIELEEDHMCIDGFATIKGNTENIIWSDGHKSQERKIYSNGTFSARTLNNGCFSGYSDTLIIDQLVLPKPYITSSKTPTICEGDSILLSTQLNHNSYNWILYENENVVGSLTNNSSDLFVRQSFTYRVTYKNKDGCKSELSDEIQIELFECWKDTAGFQLNTLTNGTRAEDYQLFSFPYKKEDQNPVSIFGDELGNYKKPAWRLFHFNKDKNEEYTKDFNTIERGKGYWLIYKDDISVHTGKVQYFDAENLPDELENYSISLNPGWNQIGNPYDIDIPWNSIQESNPGFHEDLIVFHHSFQTGDTLKAFSGGFVYVDNAFELFVPYKFMQPDKKSAQSIKLNPYNGWEVHIKLKNADIENSFGGFGMHKDAYEGKDSFDIVCLPDFPYSFQTKFHKAKHKVPDLSKDIVPMQDTYIWEFFITSDIEGETEVEFQLSDISNLIASQDNKLIIYDLSNQQQYDLRSFQKLHLTKGTHPFKAVYGDNAFVLDNEPYQTVQLHSAYPNPVYGDIEFLFTIPENSEKQNVKLVLTDTNGKTIEVLRQGTCPSGTEKIHWKKRNDINPGVYFYSLFIDNIKIDSKKMIIY